LGMTVHLTDILMRDPTDRRRLAEQCLAFARSAFPSGAGD